MTSLKTPPHKGGRRRGEKDGGAIQLITIMKPSFTSQRLRTIGTKWAGRRHCVHHLTIGANDDRVEESLHFVGGVLWSANVWRKQFRNAGLVVPLPWPGGLEVSRIPEDRSRACRRRIASTNPLSVTSSLALA